METRVGLITKKLDFETYNFLVYGPPYKTYKTYLELENRFFDVSRLFNKQVMTSRIKTNNNSPFRPTIKTTYAMC